MSTPGSALPPASSSGVPAGPMTFGQILDRVYHLLRANLKLFLGISAVPGVACLVCYALMFAGVFFVVKPWHRQAPPTFTPMAGLMLAASGLVCVVMMVMSALYEPAACYAALQANAGSKATTREAWGVALAKAGRYLWLAILRALVVAAPLIAVAVAVAVVTIHTMQQSHGQVSPDRAMLIVPIMMLVEAVWLVYFTFVMIRLAVAYPASLAENLTAWPSLVRSNRLTKGGRGRIFLVALLLYAITYAAAIVLEMAVMILAGLGMLVGFILHLTLVPWAYVGGGVLGVILLITFFLYTACTWSAFEISFAVFYHDQRLRNEGVPPAACERPA